MATSQLNMPAIRQSARYQGGVALAILVWFLAAMSLMVAGIVTLSSVDIKLAQLHIARARAEAAADGAIQLALAQMMQPVEEGEPAQAALQSLVYPLGGLNVKVDIVPLSGLINLNEAPEELLFLLFSTVEGLDESAAQELAFNVVEWRTPGMHGEVNGEPAAEQSTGDDGGVVDNPNRRFEANEDLLLVSGIDRRVYEAVSDAIYVSQEGQAGVDWATAPVVVLRGLLGGDAESAQALAESRVSDAEDALVAPSDINLTFQESRATSSYRIDAIVELGGSIFNRRRWVSTDHTGSDGLPWSFFRTEALRVVSASSGTEMLMGEGASAGS